MSEVKNILLKILSAIVSALSHIKRYLKTFSRNFWRSFTDWIDPKLKKYRTRHPAKRTPVTAEVTPAQKPNLTEIKTRPENHISRAQNLTPTNATLTPNPQELTSTHTHQAPHAENLTPNPKPYTPDSIDDFLALLKRTPRSVISQRERHVIATIMNFPTTRVSEIMLPPSAITYVKDEEILGPLVLDRLYRSGFQHFPVIDHDRRIIGLIHTTALNSLEIKKTSRASEILDPKVYYLRDDYTLNQALAAFLRTNCYFFLVIDRFERTVGMLTYEMIVDYLLGETPSDSFDRDSDRLAVAKRKLN